MIDKLKAHLTLIGLMLSVATMSYAKPMNVLFIAVDDLNDWIGVFGGHPQAKTPHIDKLANEDGGLVFDNAHCPASVCGPSRSSILSGVRPHNSGVYGNMNNMKLAPKLQDNQTISEYFGNNGYHTMSIGKIFHKHPNWTGIDEGQWAFHEWQPSKGSNGLNKKDMPLNKLPMLDGSKAKGKAAEFDWGPTKSKFEETKDYVSAKWAADKISNRSTDDKPFFMALGISKPHLAWHVPQEYFDMHPLENVISPEVHLDDLDDIKNKHGKNKFKPHENFKRVHKYGKVKEAAQAYLANVTYADACIGVVLDALNNSPHKDNTIVCIWGDHGWFLGEKMQYGKTCLWEESTRVPLIVKVPGMTKPAAHTEAIVNLVDLYSTLADVCGLPKNENIDGRSFAPVLKDHTTKWEYPTLTTIGYQNHSIRGARYRYSKYADGTEEFYDRDADPMEHTNLINNPEKKELIEQHRAMLPQVFEEEIADNDIDKKRMGRTLAKIKKESPELRKKAERNELDPEYVKSIYAQTK